MLDVTEKTEAQWDSESDARTLSDAEAILGDEKRLSDAIKAAGSMIKEEVEQAARIKDRVEALMKLAGKTDTVEGMKIINKQ